MSEARGPAYLEEQLTALRALFAKIAKRYGEKSEILDFVKDYEFPTGKALIERMEVGSSVREEKMTGSFLMAVRVADFQNMIVASHTYEFGRIVVIPRTAPAHFVCSGRALENTKVRFYIVDEREIYAAKRLK